MELLNNDYERLSVHTPDWVYATEQIRNNHPTSSQMNVAKMELLQGIQ